MERKEQPKRPVKKDDDSKKKDLKTEPPISEKDEVKQAEERTKNPSKKA